MRKRPNYESEYHPAFFATFDEATKGMTEDEFEMCYELFLHELKVLGKDPYSNSRDCQYGTLREEGFRTMTVHSKIPKVGAGDMRIIFQVDEDKKVIFYFAYGKRINTRPRPGEDIYSKAESILKEIRER